MAKCTHCEQLIFGGDACGSCMKFYKKTVDPLVGLAIDIKDLNKGYVSQQQSIDELLVEVATLRKSLADLRCELAEVRDTK
jgi:hypothetical protein